MPATSEGAWRFGPTRPSFRPTNAVRGPLRLSLATIVLRRASVGSADRGSVTAAAYRSIRMSVRATYARIVKDIRPNGHHRSPVDPPDRIQSWRWLRLQDRAGRVAGVDRQIVAGLVAERAAGRHRNVGRC